MSRLPIESGQYLAKNLRATVAGWGLAQSVGRVGPSADNAVAEAFFSSLKRELVHRHRYPDRATARRSIFERLARYNTARRHISLDCRTPDEYEAQYRHTPSGQPVLTT
ncbi:MAG: integrase core domain-containing protein [Acidimicrobiaceae bacterium]|nr:integrase core domain-containing protein [Acidimicrobiaceae bacterium]